MKILVWCEPLRLKGDTVTKVLGKAMASDGTMLCQRPFQSTAWAKEAFGTKNETNAAAYSDAYPSGYDLVWLDDHEASPEWWEALFFEDRPYKIRRAAPHALLWYFEFRDRRTVEVLGYVVYVETFRTFFVSPGQESPRFGDVFPGLGHTVLADAMKTAHDRFKEPRRAV